MANKLTSMLRIRKLLQLLEKKYSLRKISTELGMGRKTVTNLQTRISESGQSYLSLLSQSDSVLSEVFHPALPPAEEDPRKVYMDSQCSYLIKELKRVGVTRQLLWEEYKSKTTDSVYSYSQFCEHLCRYIHSKKVSYHNVHTPAEVLQVDFAGDPLYVTNRLTGITTSCPVLVCTLPCSSYTYVEALLSGRQELFYHALSNCISHIGGVPERILSDNMKQYVVRADRYEPTYNDLAEQWSVHYNTALSSTRVRKPKDKANVELHVNIVYQRIHARLRNEVFFSIEELNNRVFELLEEHNNRQMQQKEYSRMECFTAIEKPLLKPLPSHPFVVKYRREVTVNSTYHVQISEDKHFYSVPYQTIGKKVTIVYDRTEVEIYSGYDRIASFKRSFVSHGYSTQTEHLPEKHKAYKRSKEYNAAYFRERAKLVGVNTLLIIDKILESKVFVQQSYSSCDGVIGLLRKYPEDRLEAACKRASSSAVVNYGMIKNILEKKLDQQTPPTITAYISIEHDNIRGSKEYN